MKRGSAVDRLKQGEAALKAAAAGTDAIYEQINNLRGQLYEEKRKIVSARGKISRALISSLDQEKLLNMLRGDGTEKDTRPAWIKKHGNYCNGHTLWPSFSFNFEYRWYPGNVPMRKLIYKQDPNILAMWLMDEKISSATKEVIKEAILARDKKENPDEATTKA